MNGGEIEQFNNPPHTQENLSKYWWKFNVYYDASKLQQNQRMKICHAG